MDTSAGYLCVDTSAWILVVDVLVVGTSSGEWILARGYYSRILDSGCLLTNWILDSGFRILDSGCKILVAYSQAW